MELFTLSPNSSKNVFYQVNEDTVLLSIEKNCACGTIGFYNIKAIRGCFEILGCKLSASTPSFKVCSTKEYSLKIVAQPFKTKEEKTLNSSLFMSMNIPQNVRQAVVDKFSSTDNILMLTLIENCSHFLKYLNYYIEHPIFSNNMLEKPSISYHSSNAPKYNVIENHPEWSRILGSVSSKENSKTVFCGGKGVGKSTMMRYFINKILITNQAVLVLDFDPGQSEFTVMGCISAVVVTEPLLGPNFSHLKVPSICLYLGSTSVTDCLKEYPKCVEKIIKMCHSEFGHLPWFINTMGFTKDFGFKLMIDTLSRIQPTDVVQINSKKKDCNFPTRLTPEYVSEDSSSCASLNYRLHFISSAAENLNKSANPATWGLSAARKREIVVLSYFLSLTSLNNLDFLHCVPYKININNVRIIVSSNDALDEFGIDGKLIVINGNMVALCFSEDNMTMECIGFGIVRGVDHENGEIFVITPLKECEFKKVNILHMNSTIQLPQSVYKKQSSIVSGTLPYVARLISNSCNRLIRKTSSRIRPFDYNGRKN